MLTWSDVDWEHNRLRVRSPKTERHAGHEQRAVPICPKLAKILQDAYDAAPEGCERIITLGDGGYFRTGMRHAIRRAGVAEWSSLWQTLRRSCEIEWAQTYPQFAVSKWIGHSITVSGKHYANLVPDELFDKVAAAVPQAAQNPAQQGAKSREIDAQGGEVASAGTREIPGKYASLRVGAPHFKTEAEGFEPPVPSRVRRFSKPVHSATLPRLPVGLDLRAIIGNAGIVAKRRDGRRHLGSFSASDLGRSFRFARPKTSRK